MQTKQHQSPQPSAAQRDHWRRACSELAFRQSLRSNPPADEPSRTSWGPASRSRSL
jgi:hypothetical protein